MKSHHLNLERILLVRLSALGDCVAAIPVFLTLREQFPNAHIAWAIQDNFSPLIRNLPGLDEVIVFPRQRWKKSDRWTQIKEGKQLIRHLRKRKFDATVDVQSNTKSSVLAFLTRAPIRIGHGPLEAKELSEWFNNRRVDYPSEMQHIVNRNHHLLSVLGISGIEPRFSIPEDVPSKKRVIAWLHANGFGEGDYDLLFPFCGGKEKEWPGERYTALAENLANNNRRVIIGCGPGEEERAEQLIPPSQRDAVRLGPRTDILELLEMVRMARICIGGDTGPLQMAGALNIPNIAIFGPTAWERSHPWKNCTIQSIDESSSTVTNTVIDRCKEETI